MNRYIWQRRDWPAFTWDAAALAAPLATARHRQGRLIGQMESLGMMQRDAATWHVLSDDVVKSSEIEGEILDPRQVRSSIGRRLGLDVAGLPAPDRQVEGVVEMTLEATRHFDQPLNANRLFSWHRLLFSVAPPHVRVGAWRTDAEGPMRVVSGALGRERVHYEAPPAERLDQECARFLEWVNRADDADPVLHAAMAHLWFVTIHPFDDGNGRIARAISDWALARSENSSSRYYSLSAQINRKRSSYYAILERVQKGGMDITPWLAWFLETLENAIAASETSLSTAFRQERFWREHANLALNSRQKKMLTLLLEGNFIGKLTSSKWATMTKVSQDTAHRDIRQLLDAGVLGQDAAGGRSTSYSLRT